MNIHLTNAYLRDNLFVRSSVYFDIYNEDAYFLSCYEWQLSVNHVKYTKTIEIKTSIFKPTKLIIRHIDIFSFFQAVCSIPHRLGWVRLVYVRVPSFPPNFKASSFFLLFCNETNIQFGANTFSHFLPISEFLNNLGLWNWKQKT